jgi:GNAT superfamily N-acetyltransferase
VTADAGIDVRDLRPGELDDAIAVLARGMRDNPLHVAVYGEDAGKRLSRHARLMRALLSTSADQRPLCAVLDDSVVGVTGVAPPGTCRPGPVQRLRLLPHVLALGPRSAVRVLRWTSKWSRHDPSGPHVHLGPFAVDAHLQGQGIGSRILAEHCRRLDADRHVGCLETDKRSNVALYERFGFAVVGHETVLGVPCWYMRREYA